MSNENASDESKPISVDVVAIENSVDHSGLNAALNSSLGDVVVLTNNPGGLNPRAHQLLAEVFADPAVLVTYSDEEVVDDRGRHIGSQYKPDWSPERFRSHFYIGNLLAVRRSDALRAVLESAVDDSLPAISGDALLWDLVLRLTEQGGTVVHIPEILFGTRSPGGASLDMIDDSSEVGQSVSVVQAHCRRVGIDAEIDVVEPGGVLHLHRRVDPSTRVSLIIPTCGSSGTIWGQKRLFVIELVESILTSSTWMNLEFVVVADSSTPPLVRRALGELCGDRLVWVDYELPFNFSDKIDRGRSAATGEVLVLLNDDMEVISGGFIEELVGLALEPWIGAVGARLLLEDGRIQHIGHRYADGTFHVFAGYSAEYPGPGNMCLVTRECVGVTAACLAVRAAVYDEVGGMALDFPNNFNDVDFCLKLREHGYRNLVTPHATLFHFESVTRDGTVTAEEAHLLFSRWGAQLNADPYSNPNLESGRLEWIEKGAH